MLLKLYASEMVTGHHFLICISCAHGSNLWTDNSQNEYVIFTLNRLNHICIQTSLCDCKDWLFKYVDVPVEDSTYEIWLSDSHGQF